MSDIQVLIVDDSALMRRIIRDILQRDPEIKVIGTAKNGADALEQIPLLKPDVVTLDIEMPVLGGLQTLEQIVEKYDLPVIMLSSLTTLGAEQTFQALDLGAFDFIAKPSGSISLNLDVVASDLIQKVKGASKYKKATRKSSPVPLIDKNLNEYSNEITQKIFTGFNEIIAIGTSTGGPRALQEVLTKIPAHLNAAIVVVQHMPRGFTKSLAERLDKLCELTVCEAVDGQSIQNGYVYIAPGDFHMEVKESEGKYRILLHQEEPIKGHRPSVDILFRSIAALSRITKQAVLLTGMGSDGALGMQEIKERGGKTIAEAEESCVVFGMPRSAILKGCVDQVAHVQLIASFILKNLS